MINSSLFPKEHHVIYRETNRKYRHEIYNLILYRAVDTPNSTSYYDTDFLVEMYV